MTTVMLYDSMSKCEKKLLPMDGKQFRFYCCGPTVYGPAHIGNFRTFVLQDVFRRVIELAGLNPLHARNITDVDDKTIRQSLSEHKTLKAFTDHWRKVFQEDCKALDLLPPHIEPSAVGHIPEQIALIKKLLDKGHAYISEGSVYYKVSSFADYGKLAHLDLMQLQTQSTNSAGTLNQADEYARESIADFALWKAYKPEDGPNYWESPWGKGRPGWHIECSAMCKAHLGESIDLHGGGVDLIFPHHVNEIAQSEAANDQPFCRHWFHVAHLKVEGEKMSKSLGNLYTLNDLKERGFPPSVVRYLLLSGHYRQALNFTFEGLHAAQKALEKLELFVSKLLNASGQTWAHWREYKEKPSSCKGPFEGAWKALLDDLNTPRALGQIFSQIREIEKGDLDSIHEQEVLLSLASVLYALGLSLKQAPQTENLPAPEDILILAQERFEAKKNKDFVKADALRKNLEQKGWSIIDKPASYELIKNQ